MSVVRVVNVDPHTKVKTVLYLNSRYIVNFTPTHEGDPIHELGALTAIGITGAAEGGMYFVEQTCEEIGEMMDDLNVFDFQDCNVHPDRRTAIDIHQPSRKEARCAKWHADQMQRAIDAFVDEFRKEGKYPGKELMENLVRVAESWYLHKGAWHRSKDPKHDL